MNNTFRLRTADDKYDVWISDYNYRGGNSFFSYVDDQYNFCTTDTALIVKRAFNEAEVLANYKLALKKFYIGRDAIKIVRSYRTKDSMSKVIITEDNFEDIMFNHKSSYGMDFTIYNYDKLDAAYEISMYNFSRFFLDCNIQIFMNLGVLLEMFGEGVVVTCKQLNDESNWAFKKDDYVEVVYKKQKLTGSIKRYVTKGFEVLFPDGTKNVFSSTRMTKVASPTLNFDLSSLPDTIKENFESVLNSKNLKVVEFEKGTSQVYEYYNKKMVDFISDFIVCCNCGVKTPMDARHNNSCISCKQSYRILLKKDNKYLMMLGPTPAINSICIEEAKCCDNCNFFNFGHGRNGKHVNGYCNFTRQCVRSYNTCNQWFPVDEATYSSHLKGAMTNLGYGVDRYKDEDLTEFNYTNDMHEENKKHAQTLRKNYTAAYNNLLKKLEQDYFK
jgi:hypothetical protein